VTNRISKPEPGSVRDKQATAVVMLGRLLMNDLPALTWHVYPNQDSPRLEAQPFTNEDAEASRVMAAWATFLGAEVALTKHRHYTELEITAVRDGVTIAIYDHVDNVEDALVKGGAS
jgi:hypothetical protein